MRRDSKEADPRYIRVVDGIATISLTEHQYIVGLYQAKLVGLLDALDLMVNTYEEGGWPSATIVVAKAALAKARGE
jgi:hypothetical protein